MCVIAICPDKVRPDFETVQACWRANPHGGGIAWREKREVHWHKTDDVQELFRLSNQKKGEIVLHFRIASVGSVCPELRHPFPVSKRAGLAAQGSAKAVLFQNGTWSNYREALEYAKREGHAIPIGEMSDARAAAFLCHIYGPHFLKKCTPSRWVFFSAKNTATFGSWHKHCGILYSNNHWMSYRGNSRSVFDYDDEGDNECAIPGAAEKQEQQAFELWDMSQTQNYWEKIRRGPKGAKA